MNAAQQALRGRMILGATSYAQADRSDPFAYDRMMTHIDNGVAGTRIEHHETLDAFYKADPVSEKRLLPNGATFADGTREYTVTAYRNMQRP